MNLQLSIQNPEGLSLPVDRPQIRRWVSSALKAVEHSAPVHANQLTLIFLGKDSAKSLNKQFRKKDYATNVLTFELGNGLADIVICLPVLQAEAKVQKKTLANHLAHLVVHGVLHAQGFDHIKAKAASEMEAIETQVLHRFGISDPYN